MVLLHDVTAQRARMRELSNFAGMVAHDLRGPLTVLDGWLEVVEDGDPLADAALVDDAVRKARESSRRMRQVIEDWLNYTVVQNGQLRPEAIKLFGVAGEIVDGRRARSAGDVGAPVRPRPRAQRGRRPGAGAPAPGQPGRQRDQVHRPRRAAVGADQLHPDAEPGWIRIEVVDHGVGIPEGEEELIFDEFHRGPQEGRSAGTGLGLALTRRIVALHGGHMKARSNPEGGSTFRFTLPEA